MKELFCFFQFQDLFVDVGEVVCRFRIPFGDHLMLSLEPLPVCWHKWKAIYAEACPWDVQVVRC